MNILAIDTCGGLCSVALLRDDKVIADCADKALNMQAECLFPLIQTTFTTAQVSYDDLDAIGITIGPGSFTGIRVGLAAAYAISCLTEISLIGISTLELMAHINRNKAEHLCATVAAGRGRFYCQIFTQGVAAGDIKLLEIHDLEHFAAGAKLVGDYVEADAQINAIQLGYFISHKYSTLEALSALDISYLPKPVYI